MHVVAENPGMFATVVGAAAQGAGAVAGGVGAVAGGVAAAARAARSVAGGWLDGNPPPPRDPNWTLGSPLNADKFKALLDEVENTNICTKLDKWLDSVGVPEKTTGCTNVSLHWWQFATSRLKYHCICEADECANIKSIRKLDRISAWLRRAEAEAGARRHLTK